MDGYGHIHGLLPANPREAARIVASGRMKRMKSLCVFREHHDGLEDTVCGFTYVNFPDDAAMPRPKIIACKNI
jgi:hypothetical protein